MGTGRGTPLCLSAHIVCYCTREDSRGDVLKISRPLPASPLTDSDLHMQITSTHVHLQEIDDGHMFLMKQALPMLFDGGGGFLSL